MNRTRLIRQPGTKRLVEQYRLKLVCVRYRYDEEAGKRYKTVEWQRKIKLAGGKWNRERRLWEVRYDRAVELGPEDRIELKERSICRSLGKLPA